jgi:hypothetical protein
MLMIGVDLHARFQQMATAEMETGDWVHGGLRYKPNGKFHL